jgi:hypothetical protein
MDALGLFLRVVGSHLHDLWKTDPFLEEGFEFLRKIRTMWNQASNSNTWNVQVHFNCVAIKSCYFKTEN